MHALPGLPLEAAEREVVGDRHAGEQAPALRHVTDAAPRDRRGGKPRDLLAGEPDRAGLGRRDADQRFQQRGFARAVAAEQRDDLVFRHVERDRVEDVALAVEGVDLVDGEQRACTRRGRRHLCGDMRGAGADVDLAHLGVAARVLDAAVHQHGALVHHGDDIGDLEDAVDVVLDQQHGDLPRDRLHQRGDARALGGGEARERLVEQQNVRRGREREPHVEQALSAIGERSRLGVLDAGRGRDSS